MQKSNYAAVKDAKIMLRKEECVSSTEQRGNDAAVKDAQIKSTKEECATGMEHKSLLVCQKYQLTEMNSQ